MAFIIVIKTEMIDSLFIFILVKICEFIFKLVLGVHCLFFLYSVLRILHIQNSNNINP